jgi:hypothetical protein
MCPGLCRTRDRNFADYAKANDTQFARLTRSEVGLYCSSVNIVLWSNPLC